MNKLICTILSLALTSAPITGSAQGNISYENCKSAYLMDFNSGECLYKSNERVRLPIASVCKVMTLLLTFDAVNSGKLNLDDSITVSERASGMGGSQVFLQTGCTYTLSQLIKSIIVCSANDSCVAVAETVSGSEEAFVAAMNNKAKQIGCNDTLYANCTGLPKETQYSCAEDVAKTFRCLLNYDEYYSYSKIWLEDFVHPDNRITQMTNTNKLIRRYSNCDGGKTGFTNDAGFCLAATAHSNNMRLISVVLGSDSSDNRFKAAQNLFEYGFANFKNQTVLDESVNLNDQLPVNGGKKKFIFAHPERNSYVFTANDEHPDITQKLIVGVIKAPISEGDVLGRIEVYKNGIICDKVNVVASESVECASYGDYIRDVARDWAM